MMKRIVAGLAMCVWFQAFHESKAADIDERQHESEINRARELFKWIKQGK